MRKWARYRAKIESLDESEFPERKNLEVPSSAGDALVVAGTSISSKAITYGDGKGKKPAPYASYLKRRKILFWLKVALLVVVIVLLVLLYVFWVA